MVADDLTARGASQVVKDVADISATNEHTNLLARATEALGDIDLCLIAHGTLGNQAEAEQNVAEALTQINTNGVSYVSLMTLMANQMEQRGAGTLAVISSVAGDRGRKSNYVYGSAKSLVSAFAQGMAHRFANSAVNVVLIKPGLVDTPMTADFEKGPIWASADSVAAGIVKAIENKSSLKYVPFFWQPIMAIIKFLPNWVIHRTNL